jgi:hypothetical protein
MRDVMYTGVFSIGWEYFNGLQDWQICNLYHMQRYCDWHGIELRVIDNSHTKMRAIFDYARQHSGYKADSWNTATLCSLVALEEFVEQQEHDRFFWFDADVCIVEQLYNIFGIIDKFPVIELGEKTPNHKKEKFVKNYIDKACFPTRHRLSCYSGIYGMDAATGTSILKTLRNEGLFPEDVTILLDEMIELYKGDHHFVSDECIMEALVNIVPFTNIKEHIDIELITEGSPKEYFKDVFCYHFASGTKRLIKEFWKQRDGNHRPTHKF